jgi:hypothetical protein
VASAAISIVWPRFVRACRSVWLPRLLDGTPIAIAGVRSSEPRAGTDGGRDEHLVQSARHRIGNRQRRGRQPITDVSGYSPPVLRLSALLALALGLAGVVGFLAGVAFGPSLPQVVRYGNFGAAALELGLGAPLLRRRRAAWAFLISLEWTMTLVNLLAVPQMLDAGGPGYVALTFATLRTFMAVLLTLGSGEVERLG